MPTGRRTTEEIEITPEMIEAVAMELAGYSLEYMSRHQAAENIIRAALTAREGPDVFPSRRV